MYNEQRRGSDSAGETWKKEREIMLGAIIGDICGSVYEWFNYKTTDPRTISLTEPKSLITEGNLTDDTVMTIATADVLLRKHDYVVAYKDWGRRYPRAGYGDTFMNWLLSDCQEPYNSWGNGSAMRISPVGWAFDTLEETLAEAELSSKVTHNHPEGIKGAQSVAAAMFLARTGKSKQEIKEYVESVFGYDLSRTTDQIRPDYKFDVSCQGSVPESIICFLESDNFVHALQLAISIGGDTDTIACITGGIAEAFYREIPDELVDFAKIRLFEPMKAVIAEFRKSFSIET